MKLTILSILLTIVSFSELSALDNKLGVNIYGISSWGVKTSLSIPLNQNYGIWPSYSLTIRKENKDYYTFSNYELGFYYNIISNQGNDLYIVTSVGINQYHIQDSEGNNSRYIDRNNGFSLGLVIGSTGFISNWGFLNFELGFHRLYSNVQYKYLTYPITYSDRELKTTDIINLGVGFGVLL